MAYAKSLDEFELIAALLHDAHMRYGEVFNTRALKLTLQSMGNRYRSEGISLLTKTLPKLGKHFDMVLAGEAKLDPTSIRFATCEGSKLPRFLGELFSLIFDQSGSILPTADANCVRIIRDILYCFYKYKLPYEVSQEQEVVQAFKKAEADLSELNTSFAEMRSDYVNYCHARHTLRRRESTHCVFPRSPEVFRSMMIRGARKCLNRLFEHFDPLDIVPSHGPGVVSTKERLWDKFLWTNVSSRITHMWPFDAYFCASLGHVCDVYSQFNTVTEEESSAKVILVPKDSRGPRLISCEPVDFQWIQQGLSRAIVRRVESHPISRWNVFFTDQGPNQRGALLGSMRNEYSTLDLKEASDRVHLDLVRLLFPGNLIDYLEAARSLTTEMPTGEVIKLQKYAPMGSALCFPVMALTIWSLLTAAAPDADTRESILVYGDDVIVPTAFAESAITVLELFGLKLNRNKSCTKGLFKESCGTDAFKGVNVTPVRIRTVWDESPRPDVYTSWIEYANAYMNPRENADPVLGEGRRYYTTYEYIVSRLNHVYGPIPGKDMCLTCPSLRVTPAEHGKFRKRFNKHLQKVQYRVRDVTTPSVNHEIDGWSMLLRYFTEAQKPPCDLSDRHSGGSVSASSLQKPFSVSRYTKRRTSMLVWRWR
jgi:hypothetical protein